MGYLDSKKIIVFAPATFNLAETTRMIEVAKCLQTKYTCLFYGFSNTYADLIIKEGFTFSLLSPIFSKKQEQEIIKIDQMRSVKNPFKTKIVQERVKNELIYLSIHQPVVIVTGTNLTIFLSARIKQIPLIYVRPYAYLRPHIEQTQNFPPQLLQKWYLPTASLWFIFRFLLLNISYLPQAFKKTAKSYQVKLANKTIDLLSGDINLITTAPELSNTDTLPENFYSVGPIFAKLSVEIPFKLSELLIEAKKEKRTIIYFAMGSSGNRKLILKVLTLLNQLNYTVIAPVKHYLKKEDLLQFNSRIIITDFLPAHSLSPFIDFSIIHGGEGTVQTACFSGKPFIGFGLQYEQETNIRYCVSYGNGISLNPATVCLKSLEVAINLVQTEYHKKQAEQLKATMNFDGAKKVAVFIENNYLHVVKKEWSTMKKYRKICVMGVFLFLIFLSVENNKQVKWLRVKR